MMASACPACHPAAYSVLRVSGSRWGRGRAAFTVAVGPARGPAPEGTRTPGVQPGCSMTASAHHPAAQHRVSRAMAGVLADGAGKRAPPCAAAAVAISWEMVANRLCKTQRVEPHHGYSGKKTQQSGLLGVGSHGVDEPSKCRHCWLSRKGS